MPTAVDQGIDEQSRTFYRRALSIMNDQKLPYLVGGAYAFAQYTGVERHTKDFDIFVKREDYQRISESLRAAGYQTDLTFPHWLGKAYHGEDFIDLIFSAGNGVACVDDIWFEKSTRGTVLDMPVRLIPAEEMIWSKGLIMERERYDGADIAHVIHARGEQMDWRRLLDRFGDLWRPLFTHIILFGFIYPFERSKVPRWVVQELTARLQLETAEPDSSERVCYGPILSRQQYLNDIGLRGYEDARLQPRGTMTAAEIAHWTAAIDQEN